MKNLLNAFLMLALVTVLFSCTAEDLTEDEKNNNTEISTGHDEVGDPEDEDPREGGL